MKQETAIKCEQCGEVLTPNKVKWLELSQTDGNYYSKIPSSHISQGLFPFGTGCATTELKATTAALQQSQDTSTRKDELKIESNGDWVAAGRFIALADKTSYQIAKFERSGECLAAVESYNSTYGKGLNPAAMEELYKAATMALDNMENGEANTKYRYITVVHALRAALNNAKL